MTCSKNTCDRVRTLSMRIMFKYFFCLCYILCKKQSSHLCCGLCWGQLLYSRSINFTTSCFKPFVMAETLAQHQRLEGYSDGFSPNTWRQFQGQIIAPNRGCGPKTLCRPKFLSQNISVNSILTFYILFSYLFRFILQYLCID